MTTYVLDASAVLRYIDNEAGSERIHAVFSACETGQAGVCLSAIQWGEIAGKLRKRLGAENEFSALNGLLPKGAKIIPVSSEDAVRASRWKVDRGISYADAFALNLSMQASDYVLVTADYGFKAVEDLAKIEFLPAK